MRRAATRVGAVFLVLVTLIWVTLTVGRIVPRGGERYTDETCHDLRTGEQLPTPEPWWIGPVWSC